MDAPPPSTRPPRRRLSRTVPWYIPTLGVVVVLLLGIALVQGVRALAGGATDTTSSNLTPVADGTAVADDTNPSGDPLEDPTLSQSAIDSDDVMTFLLLGTDGRELEDGPPRSDTLMVAVADRTRQKLTLISIPRDLWVPIPGYGEGKVNTAYFLGSLDGDGVALAKETIEGLVGFPLEYTVAVDFDGFRNIVDEMGGVEVNVPEEIDDPEYPDENYGTFRLQIPAGQQVMDGETALRYSRTRYGGTDIDRSERQQLVLMALREKALQPIHLARAPLYLRTLYREVDTNMSLADLFALARFGREIQRENIELHTINGDLTESVITWNGQDALIYDPAELEATIQAWLGPASQVEVVP